MMDRERVLTIINAYENEEPQYDMEHEAYQMEDVLIYVRSLVVKRSDIPGKILDDLGSLIDNCFNYEFETTVNEGIKLLLKIKPYIESIGDSENAS